MSNDPTDQSTATDALHAGQEPDSATGAVAVTRARPAGDVIPFDRD